MTWNLLDLINPLHWVEEIVKWFKRPQPEIKFEYLLQTESENNYCHYRYNNDTGKCGWFFRLGINNTGKTLIRNADVRVERIERVFQNEKVSISGSPFFLHWANENNDNSRSIYPNTPVYIDIVHTAQGVSQVFLFSKQKHIGAGIKNILAPGDYLITVKLLGENIYPIERTIQIESNGDWERLKIKLLAK
ncbi:MAG: hypothetical protein AAB861_01505 [Patescibacteria group bacterium]